jgi:hypothetical protein
MLCTVCHVQPLASKSVPLFQQGPQNRSPSRHSYVGVPSPSCTSPCYLNGIGRLPPNDSPHIEPAAVNSFELSGPANLLR